MKLAKKKSIVNSSMLGNKIDKKDPSVGMYIDPTLEVLKKPGTRKQRYYDSNKNESPYRRVLMGQTSTPILIDSKSQVTQELGTKMRKVKNNLRKDFDNPYDDLIEIRNHYLNEGNKGHYELDDENHTVYWIPEDASLVDEFDLDCKPGDLSGIRVFKLSDEDFLYLKKLFSRDMSNFNPKVLDDSENKLDNLLRI